MSDQNSHKKDQNALANVRDIAFAAAIFLYFTGFIYRSEYYRAFGLPTPATLTDTATFFIYSYDVFVDEVWFSLASLLVIALVFLAGAVWDWKRSGVASIVAILAFPVLATMATWAAQSEANKYKNWNVADGSLTLEIKASAKPDFVTRSARNFLKIVDGHEMRLFALTGDAAYVTDRKYTPEGAKADLVVYSVPLNEISHFEIELPEVKQ